MINWINKNRIARMKKQREDITNDYLNEPEVDFMNADLRYADLSGANLQNAHFMNVDLRGANLAGVDITDADMFHVDTRSEMYSFKEIEKMIRSNYRDSNGDWNEDSWQCGQLIRDIAKNNGIDLYE